MVYTWTFEWITDWNKIWSDDFLEQWSDLLEQSQSSHVFFHPSMVKAWVDSYRPLRDIRPLFVIARHSSGMTVFLPLVLWKRNWKNAFLREVIPVGYSDFDYHDPIVAGAKEFFAPDYFWTNLLEELNLLGLSYDVVNITGIRTGLAGTGLNWHEDEVCPYYDISGFATPEAFLPTLKKSLRGDLRRQLRRLQEQGELTYHVYSPNDLAESLAILPRFLALHSKRWPNAYKAAHFHEKLLRLGLQKGIVHFSELRLDGKPISWHLGFVDRGRFYYYLPAIDLAFSEFSPGKVHLLKCVEEAIRLELSVYDHLRGEERYKSEWANKAVRLNNLAIKNDKLLSRIKIFLVDNIK